MILAWKKKRETRIWYVDLQYRIRVFCCKIEFYHSSFFQRLLHVDDALVAAAPEEEVFIAQCLYTISQKYGIRLKKLYKMNHLDPNIPVSVGTRLRVR